jgi:acyl-CoA thioester hydrolase
MKTQIYYHDTDCGGVVYYANYLKYLEEARTEFFAQKCTSVKELADKGIMFVVARQEIDYKYPGFYGDILEVTTRIGALTSVRIEFEHEVFNQNKQLLNRSKTVMVCVDNRLKPQAIPDELKERLLK